jgi:signal transduction histidine kinase
MGLPLYARIWLAVVLAVAVLTFMVGWAWRMAAEPPPREVVLRNAAGDVIGSGMRRSGRPPHGLARPERPEAPHDADPDDPGDADDTPAHRGPEFLITTQDGQTLSVHLPRPPRSFWNRPPFGFFWTLGLVGIAVALATYPIIRTLTRRLERLQQGVEQWGAGALGTRVPVQGNDEVAFLAQRFNTAAEHIEALVNSHKSLLANASHELRSPLARIRMGLELMQPAPGATPTDTAAEARRTAVRTELYRNIAELDLLIDEILLASRLDALEADIGTVETIDLTGLAAEECARVDALLDTGDAQHTVEVPGVARLLRRAVRNLLENARRYSQGEVELQVRCEAGYALVRVSDHGPGVPPAQRQRIFEPFYRLPGASERDGGVGLGLSLVRTIAQRHGGTVVCTDRPDGATGACFELRLPLLA